ncbi:transcription antitermination factor NusB [Dialister sp.]|uniref:transcription antitermination factor NusB n=1 Tax=Dialister sp. TaxID=1955814 RepID=UPI003F063D48
MSRRSAREYALKVLYSRELNPETEAIDADDMDLSEKDRAFADALVQAVSGHGEIDGLIAANLKHWSLSQLNVVDKNILRLALAEYRFLGEQASDRKVIMNEAIEMAKVYGGDSSYCFVNGVLNEAMKG